MLRVILVHSGPAILPELCENLGRYTEKVLARRSVEIRLKTRVKSVTESKVFLADGVSIPSRTLVWTAGTVPSPIISSLPCAKERGRLLVNQFLGVPDWPHLWAVGDCAFVPDIRNPGQSHPPTAQHAIREGRVVAQNIAAALLGGPLRPFSFKTIGLLASIGRRMGVARILGFNFSGFFAWWMWRTVYLSKLPGLDKKVRVAFDWTLDLLFPKDSLPADAAELEQRQCSWRNRSENGSQKIIRAARMILADGDCHAFRRLLSRFRHRSLAVPCHIRLMARTPIAKRTEQRPQSRAVSGERI